MDASVLYAVCSANPEEARLAQEKVRGNYENPSFVEWVVGMCQKPDNDPQILNVLCLVLVDLMRHFSKSEQAVQMWQALPSRKALKGALVGLLGALPDAMKRHVTEAISFVFKIEDVEASDLTEGLVALLSGEPQKATVAEVMELLVSWAERVSCRQRDGVNRCDPFVVQFCGIVGAIVPKLDWADATSFDIVRHVAAAMTHLVRSANESLGGDAVLNLLGFVAGALESTAVDEKAMKMKASVWRLFTEMNKIMSGDGARNGQARMAFFAAYESQLRMKVAAQIPNMVGVCQNRNSAVDQMLEAMLWYVCQIVIKDRSGSDPCRNALVTPEFVVNILLPAARLSDRDVEDFRDMPEQFLAFCMSKGEEQSELFLRNVCARLAFALRNAVDLAPILVSCMKSPIDTEAALFLIAHGHEKKTMNPELYARLFAMIPQVMSQAIIAGPSLLLALRNNAMNADAARDVAYELITKCQNRVIQIEALRLLDEALNKGKSLGSIDPRALLECVIGIAQAFHDETAGIFINNLMTDFSEQLLPFSQQLLQSIITTLTGMIQGGIETPEQETAISELIQSGVTIVENLPGEQVKNVVTLVIPFVGSVISQFPDACYLIDCIDFAASCCKRVSEPFPGMVEIINLVLGNLSADSSESCYALEHFAGILCPLLRLQLDPQVVASITACINKVISTPDQEEGVIATGLAVISCVIQNGGPIDLAQMACAALESGSETGQVAVGAVFIFAAALQVTNGEFAKAITEQALSVWMNLLELFSTYRTAKVCLIALSWLIKAGNKALVDPAMNLANLIVKKRQEGQAQGDLPAEEDFPDEGFDNEDMQDEEYADVLPADIPMPLDNVNEFQLFVESLQQTGVWAAVPDEIKTVLSSQLQGTY